MIERSDMLNNQAITLASEGNFKEAIACFKRAIVIEKENFLLWYNMGITYRDAGDLENAKNSLATAYKINPIDAEVIETYATICLSIGLYEETRELCEDGLDLNPLNTHLWNLLGVTYFKSENFSEAVAYFEQAVYINPYYVDALYNLRDTYDELGNAAGKIDCDLRLAELGEK